MWSLDLTQYVNAEAISPNVLIFLITLPLVITILGVAKYIIGVKSLGIYAPIIITYLFYQFGTVGTNVTDNDIVQGLKYGIFLTLIIFFSTYLGYKIIQTWALHYYSKLSLVITFVCITLLATLIFLDIIQREGLLRINIFSLILIATLAERFMNLIAFKSDAQAINLSLQTLFLGIICYLIIATTVVQELFLSYPYLILLYFPINFFIGRFKGLRLTEYHRFREILESDD